jgi:hypothetical protein
MCRRRARGGQLRTCLISLRNRLAVFTHQAVVDLKHPLVCLYKMLMPGEQALVCLQEVLMPSEQALALVLELPQVLLPLTQLALQAPGVHHRREATGQDEDEDEECTEGRSSHQHPGQVDGVLQPKEVDLCRAPVLGQHEEQEDSKYTEQNQAEQQTQQPHSRPFLLALRPLAVRAAVPSLPCAALCGTNGRTRMQVTVTRCSLLSVSRRAQWPQLRTTKAAPAPTAHRSQQAAGTSARSARSSIWRASAGWVAMTQAATSGGSGRRSS